MAASLAAVASGTWRKAKCIGCGEMVRKARDAHVSLASTRSGSLVLYYPIRAGIVGTRGDLQQKVDEVFFVGVAHHSCAEQTATRIHTRELTLGPDLVPAKMEILPQEAHQYVMHRPPTLDACAFCGSSDELSKEHIFPKWFYRSVPTADGFRMNGSSKGYPIPPFTAPICTTCNNTWLSVLESDVKRIAEPMLRADPVTLLLEEQQSLATWATKIAYLTDLSADPRIPRGFTHELRDQRKPPSTSMIWLGAFKDFDGCISIRHRGICIDVDGEPVTEVNAYVTTITAYRLVFQVFGHFNAKVADFVEDRDALHPALLQIWPPVVDAVEWPPPAAFGTKSINLLHDSIV